MDHSSRVETLAAQAAAGDASALEAQLIECQPDIRAFARRTCTVGEDVEEAIQLSLVAVFRHVGTFRGAAKFTTWLFTVVRNECSKLWRARQRSVQAATPEVPDDLPAELDRLNQVELIELLAWAIESLPRNLRATYIAREVEGLTTTETAELLGLTTGNVKVQLHRARQQLRALLATEPGARC